MCALLIDFINGESFKVVTIDNLVNFPKELLELMEMFAIGFGKGLKLFIPIKIYLNFNRAFLSHGREKNVKFALNKIAIQVTKRTGAHFHPLCELAAFANSNCIGFCTETPAKECID